jgi:hypothetical protein
MDGFKNSTKTQYSMGGSCGYAKGGAVKGAAKVAKVMGEFKSGALHSGSKSGPEVTNPKQAVAIGLSEARKAGAKIPMKKAGGGMVESTSSRPTDSRGRPASDYALGIGDDVAGAVARGNREPYERMPKDLAAGQTRKPRSITVERTTVSEAPASRTALDRKLSTLPSQKGEMGKGSFRREPLVSRALGALGLKQGGLSAMPRKK